MFLCGLHRQDLFDWVLFSSLFGECFVSVASPILYFCPHICANYCSSLVAAASAATIVYDSLSRSVNDGERDE